MNTVNDNVDGDRLAAKTSGATVTDINAYRANSADKSDNGAAYIPPHVWTWIFYAAILACVVLFLRRA